MNITVIELGSRAAMQITKENVGNMHYRQLQIVYRWYDQFRKA